MPPSPGLHHVTAIAGAPQPNAAFYTDLLGLRLVKRTVNFDDPGTYHLYYGDGRGRPGTILTFFPYLQAAPGRAGAGMAQATAFAVPTNALDAWMERFADRAVDFDAARERFGAGVLTFEDPDGLRLELVADATAEAAEGWRDGTVPASAAIRGFHGVTLGLRDPAPTARVLADVLGWSEAGEEDGRLRFRAPGGGLGRVVDLVRAEGAGRGAAGTVHHVAFRARTDDEQAALADAARAARLQVTAVKDRQYFRAVYFREPGGVLFEIATDAPGFATDETPESLGTELRLPPWLEERRAAIERRLPPLTLPVRA
jgi:glyoxalase family protein